MIFFNEHPDTLVHDPENNHVQVKLDCQNNSMYLTVCNLINLEYALACVLLGKYIEENI